MSQTIECTECHDLIDVEGGRTIVIPFICNACEVEKEPCECNNCEACEAVEVISQYEPSAEGEPVADTNAIIADLQQQLTQLAEYVADIEIQLQNARNDAQMSSIHNLSLRSDNEFINQQNTEVNKQLSQVRRDLKAALGIAERLA